MAPVALAEPPRVSDYVDLKSKVVDGHVEIEKTPAPPVADNYMYDFQYNHELPTSQYLGCEIPADLDAQGEADTLVAALAEVWARGDAQGFTEMFADFGVWRDKLIFTWDYRSFNFRDNIAKAAADLLPATRVKNVVQLKPAPEVARPYPDLAFLQVVLSFDTDIANGHAVVKYVLTKEGWRIWTLHTVVEGLHQYPEVPPQDGHMTGPISWESQRSIDDNDAKPEVLIIGGGQNGLTLAARLKALGTRVLIIERNAQIGEVWRKRYEYLSLHFPHWADHFPYMPFPKHWPTYTPAQKLGLFMEWYASAMEIPVWTRSNVTGAEQKDGQWTVTVDKDGTARTLHPQHVVMATSLCGMPTTPMVPGIETYRAGVIRHSTQHDSSRDWVGKKVLVIGTSSSGFDTAYDCARRDIDVTLLQRSPTYIMSLEHSVPRAIGGYEPKDGVAPNIEEQDRLWFSTPTGPGEELARRQVRVLEDLDREMLDGLHKRGLKTYRGQRQGGTPVLGSTRNGGFYFEAGACKQIIDGKIKVEQGFVERFTEDKVILSGGREREFDLIVFATGFSNTIDSVRATLGDTVADQCGPIWGVDEEGEMRSAYKESGCPGLWIFAGYLPFTRFHSKRLAIRLKALLEGVSPAPYKI